MPDHERDNHADVESDRDDKAKAAPWVAAEEMQPVQRPQSSCALDEVDEALLESFPCSDPPCYSHAHA